MSGGKESVLVQWSLDRNDKTFVSRLGKGEIVNLGLSEEMEFYGCLFSNNMVKVNRFDNNKAVVDSNLMDLACSDSDSKVEFHHFTS